MQIETGSTGPLSVGVTGIGNRSEPVSPIGRLTPQSFGTFQFLKFLRTSSP